MATVRDGVRRARLALKSFAYSGPGRGRWQHPDRVIEALSIADGERVADLGAGGGYFTFYLARAVGLSGHVYAVDTDPDTASMLTERAARDGWSNVVPVTGNPDDPALPEPVDLVLIVNAFHHLPEPGRYVETLARYVHPGGRVAVIEARPRWFLFGHATEPEQIQSIMTAAGYTLVGEHDFLPRQSFLTFARAESASGTD